MKSEGLLGLVELEASHQLSSLPSEAKRGLTKALVLVGAACEDQASRDAYWMRTLKPLGDRFNAIVTRADLKKIHNEDKVRQPIIGLLESFIGKDSRVQLLI